MTTHRRWLVVPASAVAAVIVWIVAVRIAGVDLEASAGGRVQHVGIASVISVSLVVALVATVARIALARATRARPGRGARAWVILASAVLLVSPAGSPMPTGSRCLPVGIAVVRSRSWEMT